MLMLADLKKHERNLPAVGQRYLLFFPLFACNLCPIFHVPQFLRLSSILSLYALDNKPSEI